jgi:RimJ/RimL family protein N-acetyltransferase
MIYRIETEHLVIRCWEPYDAPLLKEAVDVSVDHLLPWLPWAKDEPQTIDEKVELLRGFRARFDRDEDYVLGIFDREEENALGGTGWHNRHGRGEIEIGYWVRADRAREGIASEATAALVKAGFEGLGLNRIEIRCDPENHASVAIPRNLGFRHDATLPKRMLALMDEPRDTMVWSLFREDYPYTPPATTQIEAFDVIGRPVELVAVDM